MSAMPIKATYDARIPSVQDKSGEVKHALGTTHAHMNEQVNWLAKVINAEWDYIKEGKGVTERTTLLEKLVHATKKRPEVKYPEYDEKYGYTPSYIRRAVMHKAIGHVSSYRSNLENWIKGGKHGDEPRLGACHAPLTFYREHGSEWDTALEEKEAELRAQVKVRRKCEKAAAAARGVKDYKFEMSEDAEVLEMLERYRDRLACEHADEIRLNLYDGSTWKWYTVRLKKSDVGYINRHCAYALRGCPTLKKRGKGEWSLSFNFTFYQQLDTTPLHERRILAVDLGINNAACMAVMDSSGTVLAKKFLRFASEEDHLYRMTSKIRERQSGNGSRENARLWATVNGVNADIADKTVKGILDMAIMWSVHTVVLEHLDLSGKKRGSKTSWQRLHLWCVKRIQKVLENRAHRWGIHISRVNAWGTSAYAYDGSGKVKRGRHIPHRVDSRGIEHSFGYGTVEFSTGKLYAADLNAAYNIGARYLVREWLKVLPGSCVAPLRAEVPGLAHRSTCTLSSLWMMLKALGGLPVQGCGGVPQDAVCGASA